LRGRRSREKGEGFMFRLKSEVLPSLFIILLGSIDCATTVIGVTYFGAAELNPILTGLVSTNIVAFLVLKISASFLIGFTYILAKRILNKTMDKTTKAFKYSSRLMKGAYAGLTILLTITIINNLIILLA
jgi:Domain of unknown function (DUF5658)